MRTTLRRLGRRARSEDGSMLLELVMALAILSISIGAFMSLYASAQVSLRHASIEGNALTLVERQMEAYKALRFQDLVLSSATVPASGDVYGSNPPAAVGSGFTNVFGGTATVAACTNTIDANSECASQTMTGPDGRSYRLDSYIRSYVASGSRQGRLITVAARLISGGSVGLIKAQASSAYDPANPPT